MFQFWKKKKPLNLTVNNSRLRLDEYRSEPALVSAAQRVLNDPDLRLMLQVLQNEHPCWQVFVNSAEPHMRAANQSKGEGYTLSLSNLEAMGVPKKNAKPVEPTFENEVIGE